MGGIFISYRRADAAGHAGRLYDRLQEHFGADQVFRDVDALAAGERFPDRIEERLAGCDVLIALMGTRWRSGGNAEGRDRLQEPEDFVRLEVATALARGITVIPALLDDARMPRPEELPEELRRLTEHHATQLDTEDFHDDVTRLIEVLERHVPSTASRRRGGRRRRLLAALGAGAVFALVVVAVLAFLRGSGEIRLRSEARAVSADEARAVIVERGFHSAGTNPGAPGIRRAYTSDVEGGVLVVVDDATGLMWQQSGSGDLVQGGRQGAAVYVRELNDVRHAGFADWRLPTLEEGLSLIRPAEEGAFHLDSIFDARGAPFVWTADRLASAEDVSGDRSWVVHYLDGSATPERHTFNAYVRAVRSR